jgi:hypothetical protein
VSAWWPPGEGYRFQFSVVSFKFRKRKKGRSKEAKKQRRRKANAPTGPVGAGAVHRGKNTEVTEKERAEKRDRGV